VLKVLIDLNFLSEGVEKFCIFLGTTRQLKNFDRKQLAFDIGGKLDFTKSS
jgi:prolyl oligopeptidase PreP (S9A serine peptidase family)